ncbi:beta-eliminating lyase-related protein [Pseudoalteromonas sp. B193]
MNKARRWRKVLGGGMRQAGMLAAAGQFALEHNVERLKGDHENARYLAQQLSEISGFTVDMTNTTNMVYATYSSSINIEDIAEALNNKAYYLAQASSLG